jgi:hypothetical protein
MGKGRNIIRREQQADTVVVDEPPVVGRPTTRLSPAQLEGLIEKKRAITNNDHRQTERIAVVEPTPPPPIVIRRR